MNLEEIVALCLSYPQTTESMPFGPDVLVFKVAGKMFALVIPDDVPPRVNLKCDPDRAIQLRDEYDAILPGYHMNKRHWNTVIIDQSLPPELIHQMIDESYHLVVAKLPIKVRMTINATNAPFR